MGIRKCKECGFLLDARPNSKDVGGVCLACMNKDRKKSINWQERQEWLTDYIKKTIANNDGKYDAVVGVSGGKDSCTIVKRLIKEHGIINERLLLVHVLDEFTPTNAGKHNLDNLVKVFNVDCINFRLSPQTFIKKGREDFFNELNPLKWLESELYSKPLEVAKAYNVPLVFMGENSAFEYGELEDCEIFHPFSDDDTKIIYMGSIWPYSTEDSLVNAKDIGFRTLDDFDDWYRQGCGDNFSQIDSKGYIVHLWLKFIKFGFQRVSDMACRFVREGKITKVQAEQMICDEDWRLDPQAKKDFCRTFNITEVEFNEVVDRFANTDILVKDANGNWRRKDLYNG